MVPRAGHRLGPLLSTTAITTTTTKTILPRTATTRATSTLTPSLLLPLAPTLTCGRNSTSALAAARNGDRTHARLRSNLHSDSHLRPHSTSPEDPHSSLRTRTRPPARSPLFSTPQIRFLTASARWSDRAAAVAATATESTGAFTTAAADADATAPRARHTHGRGLLPGEKEEKKEGGGCDLSGPPDGPIAEYNRRVEAGKLTNDEHQRAIIGNLQTLYESLKNVDPSDQARFSKPASTTSSPGVLSRSSSFLAGLFSPRTSSQSSSPSPSSGPAPISIPPGTPKGIYMYGDVGCGKTMLMDLFYDSLPPHLHPYRTRIHFNDFMQSVHHALHKLKVQSASYADAAETDSIAAVAADIARRSAVLCFDEFQCTDIADAMILRRLLEGIMSRGVVIVTTSNRKPDDLYKNGIQRQSFIPAIELLKAGLTVINLDSPTDYRQRARPGGSAGVYFSPCGTAESARHADSWFRRLGDFAADPPRPATLAVWGRPVRVPVASGRAAMFDFGELIGAATGPADYLELCKRFDRFVVQNVPAMGYGTRHLARRFITFVDAVYESRGVLVLTTERPVAELFLDDDRAKGSKRRGDERQGESVKAGTAGEGHGHDEHHDEHHDHHDLPDDMRALMDDLGMDMARLKESSIFSGDEEKFAFARALSRLSEMSSREWVDGMRRRG